MTYLSDDIDIPTKVCVRCKKEKPLALFARHRGAKDKRQSRCYECNRPRKVTKKKGPKQAGWLWAEDDWDKKSDDS